MEEVVCRPYTTQDIAGLSKKELIGLVKQQFDHWPHESYKWVPKRDTTVKVLQTVLLNPDFGFGRVVPAPEIDAVGDLVEDGGHHENDPGVEAFSCDSVGQDDYSSDNSELVRTASEERTLLHSESAKSSRESEHGAVYQHSMHDEPCPLNHVAGLSENVDGDDQASRTPQTSSSSLRAVTVTLIDRRQGNSSSPMKTRVLLHVEECPHEKTSLSPELWHVKPSQLVRVLQDSPACIEGLARLSTCEDRDESGGIIYDVFAKIDEMSCIHCIPGTLTLSKNVLEIHILECQRILPSSATRINRRGPASRRQVGSHHTRTHRNTSSSSDDNDIESDDPKEERIIDHLRSTTENDPDNLYADEWRYFLGAKGKTLVDSDMIRTYKFALAFVEKWQNVKISLPEHGEHRILQRHIYAALKRSAGWFVRMNQIMDLLRKVGPDSHAPDADVISHLGKGKKTGGAGLQQLLELAVAKTMEVD